MAKPTKAKRMDDNGKSHVCSSYKLTMVNAGTAFRLELNVVGDDKQQYFLRVKEPDDRPKLVKRVLKAIADVWPNFNWSFRADDDNSITEVG